MSISKKRIRVLIVDDSALVRKMLVRNMSEDPELEVIGEAADPYKARDLMVELDPDVITLDVEMPRMDGITFLKRFMEVMPIPTVIISSLTQAGARITLDALEAGAVDVIAKPTLNAVDHLAMSKNEINQRIKRAAGITVKKIVHSNARGGAGSVSSSCDKTGIIAIGSSTGGVEALGRILPTFAADSPAILIVQHMPGGITTAFATRLNNLCQMRVKEAEDGDLVVPGQILIAPGGLFHTRIIRLGNQYRIKLEEGELVNYCRPAVDVLFHSIASEAICKVAAAVLTGMGKDGAEGMLAIRQAGGLTYAQDEATCVVFGMPKAAQNLGAVKQMLPLEQIPKALINTLR
ncbi:MAG: chemotaxis response regulator protein-glutamate methylesterase [Methylococcaceae bacterium]